MFPYVTLMLLGCVTAFVDTISNNRNSISLIILAWVVLIYSWFLLAFRYQIGADWLPYENTYFWTLNTPLADALTLSDPGYMAFNIVSSFLGVKGMWLVNGLSTAFLCWGIATLAFTRKSIGLALLTCLPYLVIVVGSGYTRQAIAIGIVMVALRSLELQRGIYAFILILLAASFHKTAVVLLPIIMLCFSQNRTYAIISASAFVPIGYFVFLEQSIDHLNYYYIVQGYSSGGALLRTAMLAAASSAYLLFDRKHGQYLPHTDRLWTLMSICGIALFILVFISPSSTMIDRIGLYFIPILVHVLGNFQHTFKDRVIRTCVALALIILNVAVFLVWVTNAKHLQAWLPYKSYLF